ncbi:MAG: transposase [Polyangiaceae bacterium]|nr:transposase [Myxococcales bacterium]MCC6902692.1 transposase [Polyangiaceae bacterium]
MQSAHGHRRGQADYRQRAATAETVNADAKTHRGLDSLTLRGVDKAPASVTFFALTCDILRAITLGV